MIVDWRNSSPPHEKGISMRYRFVALFLFFCSSVFGADADPFAALKATEFSGHTGIVQAVATSADGGRLLTAGVDKTATVWDVAKQAEIFKFTEHSMPITAAALSTDGKKALTASRDRTVVLWDADTGEVLCTLPKFNEVVTAATLNDDGSRIATGTTGGTIQLWNVGAPKEPIQTLKGHKRAINDLALSPNGNLLVSGGADKVFAVWNTATGTPHLVSDLHKSSVLAVAISSDGKLALSGSVDKTAILWDVVEKKPLQLLDGAAGDVTAVAFDAGGASVWTASKDKTVVFWDINGKQLGVFKSPTAIQSGCAVSTCSNVVVGTANGTTLLLDTKALLPAAKFNLPEKTTAATFDDEEEDDEEDPAEPDNAVTEGEFMVRRFTGHKERVSSVAFGSHDDVFASASFDGTAILWQRSGNNVRKSVLNFNMPAYSVAVGGDNRTLIAASQSVSVFYWAEAKGSPKMLNAHTDPVTSVAFCPDSMVWASGGKDGTGYIWNGDGKDATAKLKGHADAILQIDFSRDGTQIATASNDKTAAVWDAKNAKPFKVFKGHTEPVRCVAFSPDGTQLVTGSYDDTAIIWDIVTAKKLQTLQGEQKKIMGVAFTADGKRIITGANDGSISVWDVETAKPIQTLDGHSKGVTSISVSPSGKLMLSSGGTEIILWNIEKL